MPAPRLLTASDAEAYAALRREMLADSPWSFGSSPETDRAVDPARVRDNLAKHAPGSETLIFVIDDNGRLAASAGVVREDSLKRKHIAFIWGVYTTPAARKNGHCRAVMRAAIAAARAWPGIIQIELAVSANAPTAQRLYESLGFKPWGREPAALMTGGKVYDEIHMVLPA